MMFSKACEYAIRATIYVAGQSAKGRRVSMEEISKEIGSPEAFTAKVLQQLSRHQILDSTRGPSGGFHLDPEKRELVMLSDLVSAIDGDGIYTGCGLGLPECNEKFPCPIHNDFKAVREKLKQLLENTAVVSLADKLEHENIFLKV